MKLGKKFAAASMAAVMAISMSIPSFAYGEVTGDSTLGSDTQATSAYQTWKKTVWDTGARANSANIVMTPGATAKDLNFAWYSETKGAKAPAVKISKNKDMSGATTFSGEALDINRKNTSGKTYKAANHVSVEGFFEENTTYYYSYNSDTATEKAGARRKHTPPTPLPVSRPFWSATLRSELPAAVDREHRTMSILRRIPITGTRPWNRR